MRECLDVTSIAIGGVSKEIEIRIAGPLLLERFGLVLVRILRTGELLVVRVELIRITVLILLTHLIRLIVHIAHLIVLLVALLGVNRLLTILVISLR